MSVTSGQEGGCQCGAIRYRLLRAPAALYACHCRDCQKQSSSAFGLSMWVERDGIEFTGAEPRIFRTRAAARARRRSARSAASAALGSTTPAAERAPKGARRSA